MLPLEKAQRKATEMIKEYGLTSCRNSSVRMRDDKGHEQVFGITTGLEAVNGKGCIASLLKQVEEQQMKSGFRFKMKRRSSFFM